MASTTGMPLHELKVSNDTNTANLQELKGDAINNMVLARGARRQARTRHGDPSKRYVPIKKDPRIEIEFDVDTGDNMSWAVLFQNVDGNRQFVASKRSGATGNEGYKVSGIGIIDEPVLTSTSEEGVDSFRTVIRPVGAEWTYEKVAA